MLELDGEFMGGSAVADLAGSLENKISRVTDLMKHPESDKRLLLFVICVNEMGFGFEDGGEGGVIDFIITVIPFLFVKCFFL